MKKRFGIFSAVVIAAALTLTGCSSSDSATTETAASCAKADLATVTAGKLTIATGEPAYYPWVIDDKPESGEGFEGAVAYAVATQLGFTNEEVVWVRTTFDSAVTPGEKNFDFNLQQFSITGARLPLISHLLTTQRHKQSFPSREARLMERLHLQTSRVPSLEPQLEQHHLMQLKTRLVQSHRYSMTTQQVYQH